MEISSKEVYFVQPIVPLPLLLNAQKHHIEALRGLIEQAVSLGEEGLDKMAEALVPLGQGLMDFYHGPLSLEAVCSMLKGHLLSEGVEDAERCKAWIAQEGTYRTVELEADRSVWVFFVGDEERFAHVHPARYSPHTTRIRANTLKTVVMAIAHAAQEDEDCRDIGVINFVRARWLALSPLQNLEASAALETTFQLFLPAV
ncbi:hypothetical protein L6R29_25830 [Myxococcota bacterium]|nr:hypothetical protein [Myxococcota bacterium]